MQFTPKSEEAIEKERSAAMLWPVGIYPFEIEEKCPFESTRDGASKAGNDMLVLVVRLWNVEGHTQVVIDYIVEAMAHKLRHLSYACGLGEKYESGSLSATDFIGKQGTAKIKIQKGKEGYSDKNAVDDYIVPEDYAEQKVANGTAPKPAELDDEIPF